jgi:hypothetical protein
MAVYTLLVFMTLIVASSIYKDLYCRVSEAQTEFQPYEEPPEISSEDEVGENVEEAAEVPQNAPDEGGDGNAGENGEEAAEVPQNAPIASDAPDASGSPCMIATAAFGSEVAPQVQFLRNFRDNHILLTAAGSSFMTIFNSWYYSFSPYIADYERDHSWSQEAIRLIIYPLLGILQLSEIPYFLITGEYGALSSGLVASSLIGTVYFTPLALLFKQVRNGRFNYKIAFTIIASIFFAVICSIIINHQTIMMATTTLFVLTMIITSAIVSAKMGAKFYRELLRRR